MTSSDDIGGEYGLAHELVLYASPADMLDFAIGFARDGVAAGEPTVLAVPPSSVATLVDALGASPSLTVLPVIGQPGRPASDLRIIDTLFADQTTQGQRMRILNHVPALPDEHWHEWRRLEAVFNTVMQRYPAWALCAYDRRTLTDERVQDLRATHPLLWADGQHIRNDRFQDPTRFVAARTDLPDPVEQTPPTLELINPSPAGARAAVSQLTRDSGLPDDDSQALTFAASESVLNAIVHGSPPVVLRLWTRPNRVTVTVTDTGDGPTDPFVGLLPAGYRDRRPDDPGLGLWINHQLVNVTHRRHPAGYTIRITATTPRSSM